MAEGVAIKPDSALAYERGFTEPGYNLSTVDVFMLREFAR